MKTRAASIALADYLDSISDEDLTSILKCLEGILRVNLQNDRVVIPAVETIAGLFEENIFSKIEENYKYDSPRCLLTKFSVSVYSRSESGVQIRKRDEITSVCTNVSPTLTI